MYTHTFYAHCGIVGDAMCTSPLVSKVAFPDLRSNVVPILSSLYAKKCPGVVVPCLLLLRPLCLVFRFCLRSIGMEHLKAPFGRNEVAVISED